MFPRFASVQARPAAAPFFRAALAPVVLFLALFLLPGAAWSGSAPGPAWAAWSGSRQMLLVVADSWDSSRAMLTPYERSGPRQPWTRAGETIPVLLGRSGLGWGRGLHPQPPDGPVKQEGDGRAPAGVFRLSRAFGYAPLGAAFPAMPYLHLTPALECVDDTASGSYNLVLDGRNAPRDWNSSEVMRREDHLYELGLAVDHNTSPALAGAGSCIFMHLRREPPAPTAGCTALSRPNMEALALWLDAASQPVLVQLPREEASRLREAWGLPR